MIHLGVQPTRLFPPRWRPACNASRAIPEAQITLDLDAVECRRCRSGAWMATLRAWEAGLLPEPDWHLMVRAWWRARAVGQ